MDTRQPLQLLSARKHAAVLCAARQRAMRLRAEAQQEFFSAVARALRRAWASWHGGRAAARC